MTDECAKGLWAAVIEAAVKDYQAGPGTWRKSQRARNYRTAVAFLRSPECRQLLHTLDLDPPACYEALNLA